MPAVLGVLASAVGLVYYLRLVKIMYFDEPAAAFDTGMAAGLAGHPGRLRRGGAAVHRRRLAGHHRRRCGRQGAVALTHWPRGYGLKWHDEIDSTNEEARRLAASGRDRTAVAHGRAPDGGTGPPWPRLGQSPAAISPRRCCCVPNAARSEWAQLSFVAAIAAADMAARFRARSAQIALKWPNDVLADGKKLAGILLESRSPAGALAIGIGINLAHHPEDTEFPATSLAGAGRRAAPSPERCPGRTRGRLCEMV